MSTSGELITELLAQLQKDHDDKTIPIVSKYSALYDSKYLDALISISSEPFAFGLAIEKISEITNVGIMQLLTKNKLLKSSSS